jgi:hypothetical protein
MLVVLSHLRARGSSVTSHPFSRTALERPKGKGPSECA